MKKTHIIVVIILLTIGSLLIATPFIKDYIIHKNVDRAMNDINRLSHEELMKNRQINEEDEMVTELPSEFDVWASMSYKGNPVAFIYIPKTGLTLPIYGSVNETNLLYGAGEMKDYQQLGKGNYALAGHRMLQEGLLFNDIPKLKKGDIVVVTDKDKVYEYKVNNPRIITEDETEVIRDNGKDEITLLTCDIQNKPYNRVVVQGDLINAYNYSDEIFNGS